MGPDFSLYRIYCMDIIFHGVFHLVDNRIEGLLCVFYRKYEKSPNSVEPVSEIVWNCLVTVFHLLYNPICNYNNEPIEVARSHRHILLCGVPLTSWLQYMGSSWKWPHVMKDDIELSLCRGVQTVHL